MKFLSNIPRITRSLILLNLIMFLLTPLIPLSDFELMLGFGPTSEHFNVIQPLTSMFLHGGFMHLFFNMLMLYMFGRSLEWEMGHKKFLLFYLFSGLGGWLLHGLVYPDIPAIGASGAIFGIVLGMATMFPNQKISILFLPFFSFKIKWLVGIYFAFEVFSAIRGVDDGIAHLGHIGGGIVGFLLVGFWITNKFSNKLKSITNG